MYSVYRKSTSGNGFRYKFHEQTSLFGCNSGYIPYLLKATLDKNSSEPIQWHLNIEEAMALVEEPEHTLIINLKPNNAVPTLSLYELVDLWGHSSDGWTPIMFYLRGLFIEDDPKDFNEKDFIRTPDEMDDPIFSLTYLSGTVISGEISGKWTAPGPSATNSVLLWPETFDYFAEKAREIEAKLL